MGGRIRGRLRGKCSLRALRTGNLRSTSAPPTPKEQGGGLGEFFIGVGGTPPVTSAQAELLIGRGREFGRFQRARAVNQNGVRGLPAAAGFG